MSVEPLPFSQACENNKGPILEHLSRLLAGCSHVLEVGSGTGQHACWFAGHLPWLQWQPSELPENLPVLMPRCERYAGSNLLSPLALDARDEALPIAPDSAVFTANTLHIMGFRAVEALFRALAASAPPGTLLLVYGPFNYGGQYTSPSNARFDQWLSQQSRDSAIRDFERVDALAASAGFHLLEDNAMPANNRLLVWRHNAPRQP